MYFEIKESGNVSDETRKMAIEYVLNYGGNLFSDEAARDVQDALRGITIRDNTSGRSSEELARDNEILKKIGAKISTTSGTDIETVLDEAFGPAAESIRNEATANGGDIYDCLTNMAKVQDSVEGWKDVYQGSMSDQQINTQVESDVDQYISNIKNEMSAQKQKQQSATLRRNLKTSSILVSISLIPAIISSMNRMKTISLCCLRLTAIFVRMAWSLKL